MALKECLECKQKISSQAAVCPYCGTTSPSYEAVQRWWCYWIAVVAWAISVVILLGGGC